MDIMEFSIRILVALAAGMIIGLERQIQLKNAGLRTNSLVALGSAVYVLLSLEITGVKGGDATRIIGQVVTGIGFLGAGVILHRGFSVHGLTTAATIWCSSAVGCLAAAGYFTKVAICTFLILMVNYSLRNIDDIVEKFSQQNKKKNKSE